ncbi:MAG: DUF1049 domain-containing protein [Synechocystis sp.]
MRSLLFLVLTATGLIFFLQNRQPVTLFFLGTSQQSALASLTLPLGLWVVIFTTVGIVTSLLINGLSRIGQPQRRSPNQSVRPTPPPPEPSPPPRSPSPRYQAPTTEPVVNDSEWDWDNPIPEIADWNGTPPQPSPEPTIQDRRPPRPSPLRPEPREPKPIADRPEFIAPEPRFSEPESEPEPEPPLRQPLPDLRQFEAPQTPTETKRQGTIYSQQYRPARSSASPASQSEPAKPKPVYDVPYRVINSSSSPPSANPDSLEDSENDEDWI